VTIRDSIGCEITDSVTILNDPGFNCEIAITIYNGFSPNLDQVNDAWIIKGINTAPENSVKIINRWGDVVWKGEKYDNGPQFDGTVVWEGTNEDNKILPDGTYFYMLEINNKLLQQITIDGKPFFGKEEVTWNNVERPLSDKAVISGWVEIMR